MGKRIKEVEVSSLLLGEIYDLDPKVKLQIHFTIGTVNKRIFACSPAARTTPRSSERILTALGTAQTHTTCLDELSFMAIHKFLTSHSRNPGEAVH